MNVDLTGMEVFLKVWRIDVGRVKLYLLDTNIPENLRRSIAKLRISSTAATIATASGRRSCWESGACARSRRWA